MANVLDDLIPDAYAALNQVCRELTGFIVAATMSHSLERVAVGQEVIIPIAPPGTATDVTPSNVIPNDGDNTFGDVKMTIQKSRRVPFKWTGEEELSVSGGTPGGALTLQQNQIAEAMRTLINEMESDGGKEYKHASRAFGTSGTTPFAAGNVDSLSDVVQILDDNGCPQTDRQFVMNTVAGNAFRKIANLYKANEAGTDTLLRQGVMSDIYGLACRMSAGVALHVKGDANGAYLTNLVAPLVAGATDIAVDTGAGTLLEGDVITFAGDTNQYVIGTALAGGVLSVNKPGLRAGLADGVALALTNGYRANMAFHRSALLFASRPPATPKKGDLAIDKTIITDPRTGVSLELAAYAGYMQILYEVRLAWGWKAIKPEFMATLKG